MVSAAPAHKKNFHGTDRMAKTLQIAFQFPLVAKRPWSIVEDSHNFLWLYCSSSQGNELYDHVQLGWSFFWRSMEEGWAGKPRARPGLLVPVQIFEPAHSQVKQLSISASKWQPP